MEIIIDDYESSYSKCYEIKDYVKKMLSGEDYERGRLEECEASINNMISAFSRLLEFLVKNNKISPKDLVCIVEGSNYYKDVKVG